MLPDSLVTSHRFDDVFSSTQIAYLVITYDLFKIEQNNAYFSVWLLSVVTGKVFADWRTVSTVRARTHARIQDTIGIRDIRTEWNRSLLLIPTWGHATY